MLLPLVLLAGCGSMAEADLPDPAGPPVAANMVAGAPKLAKCRDQLATQWLAKETRLAVLCGRERTVEIYDTGTGKRVATAARGHRADRDGHGRQGRDLRDRFPR